MRLPLVLCAGVAQVMAATSYSAEALKDEITYLPDAPNVDFKMFSGYINVAPSRSLFYWFVEKQDSVTSDTPVLLWTNGGPGCSGLGGFMSEQGPFRPTEHGDSLVLNPYAWNKLAHMVFIEQPAGVGFSTAPTGYSNYTDATSAQDMHMFVKGFFQKFNNYQSNDFYITSESYGGHYMPTLAQSIAMGGDVPNFRGVKLGNPVTFMESRNYGQYGTMYGHQLYPKQLWETYAANNCHKLANAGNQLCRTVTEQIDEITKGLDPYALDFPVCNSKDAMVQNNILSLLRVIKGKKFTESSLEYDACAGNEGADYLNRKDVQAAIHVQGPVQWQDCNDMISIQYSRDSVNANMVPIWQWLLNNTDGRYMIYSGDDDTVCATLGTQQYIWDMGFSVKTPWAAWKVDDQVAGFYVDWDTRSKAKWALATVHGAGHMVPQTQPKRSFALLKAFLSGDLAN